MPSIGPQFSHVSTSAVGPSAMRSPIAEVPDHLLIDHLAARLDPKTLARLMQVSKRWHAIASDPLVWERHTRGLCGVTLRGNQPPLKTWHHSFCVLQNIGRTPLQETLQHGPLNLGEIQDIAEGVPGTLWTVSANGQLARWNTASGRCDKVVKIHEKSEFGRLHTIGDKLVTSSRSGFTRAWDLATGRLLEVLPHSYFATLCAAGRAAHLEIFAWSTGAVMVRDVHNLQSAVTYYVDKITAAAIDGTTLVTGDRLGQIKVWDLTDPVAGNITPSQVFHVPCNNDSPDWVASLSLERGELISVTDVGRVDRWNLGEASSRFIASVGRGPRLAKRVGNALIVAAKTLQIRRMDNGAIIRESEPVVRATAACVVNNNIVYGTHAGQLLTLHPPAEQIPANQAGRSKASAFFAGLFGHALHLARLICTTVLRWLTPS